MTDLQAIADPDGWRFTERVYEVRHLDATPLAGSAPHAAGGPARTAATRATPENS